MKVRYDTEELELTPRMEAALVELMKAQCEMMAEHEPDGAWCWEEGRCYVGDLASSRGLTFCYGAKGDFDDGRFGFVVLPAIEPAAASLRKGGINA